MPRGSSIRIYLADGTVTGIRHAEVVNWTGQAVACPRSRINELSAWQEAHRPGAYLLLGTDETSGKPAVYVGEAENVWARLQDHLVRKDFWNEVILFTNKDENLTKAHVRYLESKIFESASTVGRYSVMNGNTPQLSLLPRGDRDSMESFLEQIRILLGVLGHRVLEPIAPVAVPSPVAETTAATTSNPPSTVGALPGTALRLAISTVTARAVLSDEGIVVLAGSLATANPADSLGNTYRKLREQLINDAVLAPEGSFFRFTQDFLFSSPTAAACVVVGYAINGRAAWKTDGGQSINDLESVASLSTPP
jgi:hypothetical protein